MKKLEFIFGYLLDLMTEEEVLVIGKNIQDFVRQGVNVLMRISQQQPAFKASDYILKSLYCYSENGDVYVKKEHEYLGMQILKDYYKEDTV